MFSYALLIPRGVSNEDNTTFIIVVIFFCGCVPEVVVPCAVGFLYIPKKLGLCILLLCSLMMCAYTQVHYGPMVVFVCLHIKLPFYHHYADSVSSVCLRFSQFSLLSFMQYMGLCLLSSPIPVVIVRIRILYLIIIIK